MEFIDELFILLVVLQGVYNLYQRVTGGNAGEQAENMPPPEEDDGTWTIMLVRARERTARAREQLARNRQRAQRVAAGLGGAAVAPLRRAIEQRLVPEFDRIDAALAALAARLAEVDLEDDGPEAAERAARLMSDWAARADEMRELLGRQARLVDVLGALEGAARWRNDPRLGPIMADVDAVAASMLAPLAAGAGSGWFDWPGGAPLTLPEVGDPDAVRGLLAEHPVVFVDTDVADGQTRWPAVIEAVARTVVRTRPALLRPIIEARHPGVPAWLPRQQGRRVVFDLQAAAGAWFEAVAVDVLAALMMGPAALMGLIERLARPDDPFAVVRARPGPDHHTLSAQPPAHLRAHLTAAALTAIGYDVEARALLNRWNALHGEPAALSLPSAFGVAVVLPVEPAVEALRPWITALLGERHDALGGRALSALTHFEMSPGLWSRARERATRLSGGRSFSDAPRIIVAAALVVADGQGFDARLDRAVHRLITHPGERAPADPHYRPRRADLGDPLTGRDLLEAVVLRAALDRPHGQQRTRRRL